MGESFGAWRLGQDAQVMPWITSANIACGFHAGDFSTMQQSVLLAKKHGVALGAHVSLPDLQGFGRRELQVTRTETYALTLYQIGALAAFARAAGARLAHVKPHGALYNMAARDVSLAEAIAQATRDFDATLILFGLAGSALTRAGTSVGLRVGQRGVRRSPLPGRWQPDAAPRSGRRHPRYRRCRLPSREDRRQRAGRKPGMGRPCTCAPTRSACTATARMQRVRAGFAYGA